MSDNEAKNAADTQAGTDTDATTTDVAAAGTVGKENPAGTHTLAPSAVQTQEAATTKMTTEPAKVIEGGDIRDAMRAAGVGINDVKAWIKQAPDGRSATGSSYSAEIRMAGVYGPDRALIATTVGYPDHQTLIAHIAAADIPYDDIAAEPGVKHV